jgi:predicted KAP-like P-loop ATPase
MNRKDLWTDQPTTDDQLGFKAYRNTLVGVIRQADTPITIGIFGKWGSGKTSLMRMVQKDLGQQVEGAIQAQTVWFDAWKYDKEDVLWRALLLSALEAMRPPEDQEDQELNQELDDLQTSLYRNVDREETGSLEFDWHEAAKGTLKLGLTFLPLVPQFMEQFSDSKKTGPTKDAVDNLVKTFKRERVKIHRDQVQFLEQFQDRFSKLIKSRLPSEQRLVVFIDDLDRCLPEKAIEILEAIKLFLDAKQCVFVVGVERRIIEKGIKVKYRSFLTDNEEDGIPISGDEYLEKIVQIPFHLPPLETPNIKQFVQERMGEDADAESIAEILSEGMEANPRKIKRVLNVFRLLWTLVQQPEWGKKDIIEPVQQPNSDKKDIIESALLAKLVVIQSRWRDTLYADVIEYPHLLENLENHFERSHLRLGRRINRVRRSYLEEGKTGPLALLHKT